MTVRKSSTEEFKRQAVRLAKERGKSSAVARDLGIRDTILPNRFVQSEASRKAVVSNTFLYSTRFTTV